MIPKQLCKPETNLVLLKPKDKVPFQKDWQKKDIRYDDAELLEHINTGGNYGVRGGGKTHLIIVDFDSADLQEEI